jgi:hypothetical protein
MGGIVVFCLALLLVAAPFAAAVRIAIALSGVAFLWACWSRWSRVGVLVQTNGMWVWRPMWRRFMPWDEIEQFRPRQRVASCAAVRVPDVGTDAHDWLDAGPAYGLGGRIDHGHRLGAQP